MPRLSAFLLPVAAALAIAACGSDSDGSGAPPPQPKPTARAEDFPSAEGKSLIDLRTNVPEGPVLAPSVSVLERGNERVAFALFDRARKQISGAQVALYVGKVDGSTARGPYPARFESLEVKPQFRSRQTASDPDSARGVYVADVPLQRRGKLAIMALARLDGRLLVTNPHAVEVDGKLGRRIPDIGERPPRVHTETRADVGGDLEKIDTRIPPLAQLHEADFADALGRKPVVLVFATPQLCASRVCGPVVDVAAQVKSQVGDRVEFIHQEIYRENNVSKGFRPQLQPFGLVSEPWTFVIDRSGRVVERFEGAYSVGELSRAVAKVA